MMKKGTMGLYQDMADISTVMVWIFKGKLDLSKPEAAYKKACRQIPRDIQELKLYSSEERVGVNEALMAFGAVVRVCNERGIKLSLVYRDPYTNIFYTQEA